MQFEELVFTIQQTHDTLQESAVKAINKHLTIRNWLIGLYIIEFEQNGEDRAKYGEKLLQKLAERLSKDSLSYRNLKLYFGQHLYHRNASFLEILLIARASEYNKHLVEQLTDWLG
jgi:DUF1016 N-terminal domain